MAVRRVEISDLDLVVPLFDAYRRFYTQEEDLEGARAFLSDRLEGEESVIFLADSASEPAGFAQLFPTYSSVRMIRSWLLNDLFVDPGFRGKGVGRELMDHVIAYARETGRQRVELETATDNTVARALYESMGFERGVGFETYTLMV